MGKNQIQAKTIVDDYVFSVSVYGNTQRGYSILKCDIPLLISALQDYQKSKDKENQSYYMWLGADSEKTK